MYHYVKITVILKEHGEQYNNLSKFIKSRHYDHYLSFEKLQLYEQWINQTLEKLHNIH